VAYIVEAEEEETNIELSTANILARKSEEALLPYCKTGAESSVNNPPGPIAGAHFADHTSKLGIRLTE
jgi:hypothetical protein